MHLTMPPVELEPVVYKVWRNGIPGEEYFLLENREPLLHDAKLPGHGLLIWHVDESAMALRNASVKSPAFDFWMGLEQADGLNEMNTWFDRPIPRDYYPELGDGADPFPGDSINSRFDNYSNPSSRDNGGLPTDVSIVDISLAANDIHMSVIIDSTLVAVYFSDFSSQLVENGIELVWDVLTEDPVDGFKLYRRDEDYNREVRIPEYGLIPAERRRYVDETVCAGATYSYVLAAVKSDGSEWRSWQTSISMVPASLALFQNRPNPFNPSTAISFSLPTAQRVRLSVYNVEGKRIRTLMDEIIPATPGKIEVEWDGRNEQGEFAASGTYVYRLETGGKVLTRKMLLVR